MQIIMALLLDAVFGDPRGIPHPVAGIGRLISFYEKFFYGRGGSKAGGALLCAAVLATVGGAVALVLSFAAFIGEWAYAAVNIYLLYAAIAFKSLKDESAPGISKGRAARWGASSDATRSGSRKAASCARRSRR